jgi:hypothetical protein
VASVNECKDDSRFFEDLSGEVLLLIPQLRKVQNAIAGLANVMCVALKVFVQDAVFGTNLYESLHLIWIPRQPFILCH